MRPIPVNYTTHHSLIVEARMTVDLEQPTPRMGRLHDVYSTYWMTKHAELTARKIILPFLEPHEEGIGFEVRLKHIASALPGMRVTHEAVFEKEERNRIYAQIKVVSELDDLIGIGHTVQVVMKHEALKQNVTALKERWEAQLLSDFTP